MYKAPSFSLPHPFTLHTLPHFYTATKREGQPSHEKSERPQPSQLSKIAASRTHGKPLDAVDENAQVGGHMPARFVVGGSHQMITHGKP